MCCFGSEKKGKKIYKKWDCRKFKKGFLLKERVKKYTPLVFVAQNNNNVL
jgi:hypothetical protein